MAEKKVIVFTCDRCGLEHRRLRGKNLPAGWEAIKGKDLCPVCSQALTRFLEPVEPAVTVHHEPTDANPITALAASIAGSRKK